MINKQIVSAFLAVAAITVLMCFIVYLGYFKTAYGIELGIAHYAERVIPSWKKYIPQRIHMPFNSLINGGYVIVGAAWCAAISIMLQRKKITVNDAFCFYVFNLLACCYGPIQFLRIISHFHAFGVLDQWYTLPFFMWVFNWGLYIRYGWNSVRTVMLIVLSVLSYISVLYYRYGFEICLGFHILVAIGGATLSWTRHPQARCTGPFIKAVISCLGFIGFKLLDHTLPQYHIIFRYISGHFISKIFDIGQVYYVNQFFLAVTLAAFKDTKKKVS